MEISPIVCWVVAGIILVGLDMLLGTFYLIVMGIAAAAGALAAWAGLSLGWQVSIFAGATIVGGLVVSRMRSRAPSQSEVLQHPDKGQTVTVEQWNADGSTRVMYRGAQWTAYAQDALTLKPGLWRIVRVDGARLIIEPLSR